MSSTEAASTTTRGCEVTSPNQLVIVVPAIAQPSLCKPWRQLYHERFAGGWRSCGSRGRTGERRGLESGFGGSAMGDGRTKPICGEVVGGEGFGDVGTGAGRAGSTTGVGAGAAAVSALSFSRAWMARRMARRVASTRYWSFVKVPGLQDAAYPRGYFCGSRNLSSLWDCRSEE